MNNHQTRSLLIGNGINRIFEGQKVTSKVEGSLVTVTAQKTISWTDLLSSICLKFGTSNNTNSTIPSPVFFESIINGKTNPKGYDANMKQIKESISSVVANSCLQPNKYHSAIMEMTAYSDILTTNYDYCLEKAVLPDFSKQRVSLAKNKEEYAYSLKRRYSINDKNVWHIHGELFNSRKSTGEHYPQESILIGFEQYCLYLNNIIQNIKERRNVPVHSNQKDWAYKPLMQRMKDDSYDMAESPFWIDRFFAADMDIVGFGFDYSETHLWWLLSYRARLINEGKINNNIRFFFPDMDNCNPSSVEAGIRFMLNSLKVECVPIKCKNYEEFYDKFIKGI